MWQEESVHLRVARKEARERKIGEEGREKVNILSMVYPFGAFPPVIDFPELGSALQ